MYFSIGVLGAVLITLLILIITVPSTSKALPTQPLQLTGECNMASFNCDVTSTNTSINVMPSVTVSSFHGLLANVIW